MIKINTYLQNQLHRLIPTKRNLATHSHGKVTKLREKEMNEHQYSISRFLNESTLVALENLALKFLSVLNLLK
jgi:hypothetical protein